MGTRDATVTGIRKHGVSNPLGWDGDTTFQMPFNGFPVVSNPQGWDGDFLRENAGVLQRLRFKSTRVGWGLGPAEERMSYQESF